MEQVPQDRMEQKVQKRRRLETLRLTPEERMDRFIALQEESMSMLSEQGLKNYHRRNHAKRRIISTTESEISD